MADSFDLLKNIGRGISDDSEPDIEENEEVAPREDILPEKEAIEPTTDGEPYEEAPVVEVEPMVVSEQIEEPTQELEGEFEEEIEEESEEEKPIENINIFKSSGKLGRKKYAITIVLLACISYAIKFTEGAFNTPNNDILFFSVDFTFLVLNIIATIKRLRDIGWPFLLALICLLPVQFALAFNVVLSLIPSNLIKDSNEAN